VTFSGTQIIRVCPVPKIFFFKGQCRDPSRHFSFQSPRLLTKNFKSEVIGIGNADVVKLRGRAIKQGLLSALSAFLLHKTRDTPSRVNREVSKSFDMNNWHIC
jgi:hypothetical protein